MLKFSEENATDRLSFEAYGVKVQLWTNSPDLLARAVELLPPGWLETTPDADTQALGILVEDDGTYSVYNAPKRVSEGQGAELSLIVLDGQIRGYVALHSPELTFIHAGAVAHQGRAIIFPGQSFSGKTTLTAALVRAGATYYSDEFAVLDADGRVHPYAKPLSLRDDPGTSQVDQPVEALGGVAGKEPVPIGLAVITSYRPGAVWSPERIPLGTAAMALVASTVTVRSRPDAGLKAVARALEGAVALRGERGEADEIAEELLRGVFA